MTLEPETGERRRVQRVRLTQPLRALIESTRIFIVDLSRHGLRVMHQDDIGRIGKSGRVVADWDGHRIELQCTIVRTALHRAGDTPAAKTLYHSGLTIVQAIGSTDLTLKRFIEHHVERALDEQKANARGVPPPLAAQSMQSGGGSTYVRHEYNVGRWREVMTATPVQPESGFTISSQHSATEVEMLRRAYERAVTFNDRAIIKRLAAMSLAPGEVVQARRYEP